MNFKNGKTFGEMGINSYPLSWPMGWKKTNYKKRSAFKTGFAKARDGLFRELKLMGVPEWNIILSTNVALRKDGLPYAGMAQPSDTGVAVYFRYKAHPMVFACDTYHKVEDNLYAICKTVEAIRGIERWGASEMLERTFTGFQALPPPPHSQNRSWWDILGLPRGCGPQEIKDAYRKLAQKNHPDVGGSHDKMTEINNALNEALKEVS